MTIMPIKFGTDGWRAIISDEFTFANVRIVAQAIADYINNHGLGKRGIIVGYDSRFLSDKFAEECVKIMLQNGISCFLPDRDLPTPVVAYEVNDRKTAGAIMITASHNPPQYSGIKFIPEYAGPASQDITKEIEEYLKKYTEKGVDAGPHKDGATVERFNPKKRYVKFVGSFIDIPSIKKSKIKIVCDPMFGAGRGYLSDILEEMGLKVEEIHGQRDANFGGLTPEPTGEHLEELKDKVVEEKASLGLANDGDADRFGVIDETGRYMGANQIFPLLFLYLLEDKKMKGSVVRSVATTHMIDKIAKLHKVKVHETPVGFKHIAKIMMSESVVIGGEESGGLSIKGHVPEKDGILACLLVVDLVAKKKKPLSKIYSEFVKKIGVFIDKKINYRIEEKYKQKLLELLRNDPPKKMGGIDVRDINRMDGVKLNFKDGNWMLIRPSGTEPLLRVYFESSSEEKIKQTQKDFEKILESVKAG